HRPRHPAVGNRATGGGLASRAAPAPAVVAPPAGVRAGLRGNPRGGGPAVTAEIKRLKGEWMAQWMPKLTSSAKPLSPYRVIRDLLHTVDVARTIVTHDAGSPRDQISPFWECTEPLSYIGWGKTTQLGYGLGLAMGAKLAHPDKLCVNVWR